jgi:hypothetical protein
MATLDQWAYQEHWAVEDSDAACLLELRAKVEALEGKYETMRLATLEWDKDVENLQRWSDQHLKRIERLEGNHPAKPDGSLVERVAGAIADDGCALDVWHDISRAAIREVAAALRQADHRSASNWLLKEAAKQ